MQTLSLEQDSQTLNPVSTAGDEENQDNELTQNESDETEANSKIPTKTQLKAMNVDELKELADNLGIEYEYTNKDDLIVLILAKYEQA